MKFRSFIMILIVFSIALISCNEKVEKDMIDYPSAIDFQKEKSNILQTINDETAAAFSRKYIKWKEYWVHKPYVTKTYIDFSKNSFSETLGWKEVDKFVKTYIENHPEPDSIPNRLLDADIRLYGSGAWVSFEQRDPERGKKRETRLMEKEDGSWKIAGMHTTIYK